MSTDVLSRQCRTILRRLRRGPALGHELNRIAHRFGARICAIRKSGVRIRSHAVRRGVWEYSLIGGGK